MDNSNRSISCPTGCWIAAVLFGLLCFLFALVALGWGGFGSLVLGLVMAVASGLIATRILCSDAQAGAQSAGYSATGTATSGAAATTGAAAAASAAPASAPAAEPAPAATAPAPVPEAAPEPAAPAAQSEEAASAESEAGGDNADLIKPSTALPGQADLAERKGSWRYEGAESEADSADADTPATETPTQTPAAPEPEAEQGAPAKTDVPGDLIKPSTALPGQAELAERKGSWRYEPPATASAKGQDYDGDGVVEGSNEGSKPATLSAARDGNADDLKRIKGIGPKLEKLCNSLGFYHFDQIAAWSADEVAWVDANLEGFKGRVTRDTWVEQAKLLATGQETEFSKKVDKGDVY